MRRFEGDRDGPPSEGDFLRALRDHVLETMDLGQRITVPGLTPAELEEKSGLSRPSVAGLIKRFAGVLDAQSADGGARRGPGEQARRWAVSPDAGIAIGAEMGATCRVAIADLYGRVLDQREAHDLVLAEDAVDWEVQQIRDLVPAEAVDDVVGVGVSLPAPIDRVKGLIRSARLESASDWEVINVRAQLRSRLGWETVPILLDNDANLSALAEHVWGAARPSPAGDRPRYRHVVYVEWSRGVGAGLILNGEVFHGMGIAGELGHTVIHHDAEGEPCRRCGRRGCLETQIGWERLLRRLPEYCDRPRLDERDLIAALETAGDRGTRARAEFDGAAGDLAKVLGPVIHLLNPELVIVGGDVGRHGYDIVRTALMPSLMRLTMRPALEDVTIVPPKLTTSPPLQGALALVLRQPHRESDPLVPYLQRKRKAQA